jgi:putative transposase
VRTARPQCLDRILIYGARHLLIVLADYLLPYNEHRPHQHRGQPTPDQEALPPVADLDVARMRRRKILNGLANEYTQAA